MSAQHIKSQAQETAPMIRWRMAAFIALMVVCAALFVMAVAPVWTFGDDYTALGADAFAEQAGSFTLWAFSVPLGVLCGLLGASLAVRANAGRVVAGILLGLVALALPFSLYPGTSIPIIFGAGGVIIELTLLALIWFWYKERSALQGGMKLAADLQIGGYMFFAFAAWFICGMGGMPSFALYPEKMIEFGTQSMAVRLMYAISLNLVLGWILTAVSQFLRSREVRA